MLQGVLRRGLGFDGVILSDDLGGAAAVRSVPAGDRAVRFLAAGGDMVLAVGASTAGTMLAQVLRTMRRDAAFRARVAESAGRILRLKRELGLLGC